MPTGRRSLAWRVALVWLGILWRLPYVWNGELFFTSDAGITGLMARHILQGEWSFYFWGAGYSGTAEHALMAGLFHFFGATPSVLALVPFFWWIAALWLTHRVLDEWEGMETANLATLLLAVPSPMVMWATFRLPNYMLITLLGLWQCAELERLLREKGSPRPWAWWGVAAGFSWYLFKGVIVVWAAMGLWLFVRRVGPSEWRRFRSEWKKWAVWGWWELCWRWSVGIPKGRLWLGRMLVGIGLIHLAVATPLGIFGSYEGIINGQVVKLFFWSIAKSGIRFLLLGLLIEWADVVRSRVKIHWQQAEVRAGTWGWVMGYSPALLALLVGEKERSRFSVASLPTVWANAGVVGKEFLAFFHGNVPEMPTQYLVYGLALAGWLWALIVPVRMIIRRMTRGEPWPSSALLGGWGIVALGLTLCFDRLGDAYSLRYAFLALWGWILAMGGMLTWVWRRQKWPVAAALLILVTHSAATHLSVWRQQGRPSPQAALSAALLERGWTLGYADFWIAYYLDFISEERLTIVPTGFNDAYAPYRRRVQEAAQAVVIGESAATGGEWEKDGVRYRVKETTVLAGYPVAVLEKTSQ